jgi:N-acetylglucosamine kinase-like BadF-type ATPase
MKTEERGGGSMIYIGVDGGGSKTALAAFEDGVLLATARAGAINYNFIGVQAAAQHLLQGVAALGVPTERIAAIGIGDPSIDDTAPAAPDSPTAQLAAAVQDALGVPVFLRSDAYMTLFGLTGGCGRAVLMLAGTGAMGIAEDADGAIRVAGGWGRLSGDEGSGYYIATEGIRAALQAADGIAESTALLDAALAHFGVSEPRALIGVFYGEPAPDIASFSVAVAACAAAGDTIAHRILLRAAEYLAAYTCRLIEESGAITVGVYGSVICKNATVRGEFERLVREGHPDVHICEPTVLPEQAAADYAKKLREQGEMS